MVNRAGAEVGDNGVETILKKVLVGLLIVGAVGCSSSGGGTKAVSARGPLKADEIATSGATTAFEAIQFKRPMFFQSRGPKSIHAQTSRQYPVVYVNGMYYGDIAHLRTIPSDNVEEISFMSDLDATLQFGTGHANGVIMVLTKK